jgi:hypothetical protein
MTAQFINAEIVARNLGAVAPRSQKSLPEKAGSAYRTAAIMNGLQIR